MLDPDREQPIPGVSVTTEFISRQSGDAGAVASPTSTVTDDSGRFVLDAILPADWGELSLALVRSGYEPTRAYIERKPEGPRFVVGPAMYPTLTIHAGQVMDVEISLGSYTCGWDQVCRRLLVESLAGELIDVEVTAVDTDVEFGVHVNSSGWSDGLYQRLVTLPGGEVWIYASKRGKVKVNARRH